MTTDERKADTRRKIQLGGLVIKAGLAAEDAVVLLGMLASGARVLKGPLAADSRRRWKEIGERLFGSGP
ncbi:MAG TPA: conjugal transfer protein TraD [Candidatus Binataceae bacterium]|nr:conjugal transfer protein TraD [Candidatus Binataceae bacterium]